MKHNLLSLILATTIISSGALSSSACFAQEAALPEAPKFEHKLDKAEMHKKMAEKIAKDLNLSEEQQQKAKEIRENGKKEIEPLMEEMKDLREKMDTKRKANMEEFEKILTPEQKAKFEELKKNAPKPENRNHFRGPRHTMHSPHGPHMMQEGKDFAMPKPQIPEVVDAQATPQE